eukprot:TRINITY_DN25740_c0_g1_i1.p1 TRINITY_DN25740_c0_g1~~TRINITY_DN25740_c0_g1_i1.p1  ORF type:complete len:284 (+),score=20.96 TRINITY_DN25740_c0_g1_i1:58-909(+)
MGNNAACSAGPVQLVSTLSGRFLAKRGPTPHYWDIAALPPADVVRFVVDHALESEFAALQSAIEEAPRGTFGQYKSSHINRALWNSSFEKQFRAKGVDLSFVVVRRTCRQALKFVCLVESSAGFVSAYVYDDASHISGDGWTVTFPKGVSGFRLMPTHATLNMFDFDYPHPRCLTFDRHTPVSILKTLDAKGAISLDDPLRKAISSLSWPRPDSEANESANEELARTVELHRGVFMARGIMVWACSKRHTCTGRDNFGSILRMTKFERWIVFVDLAAHPARRQ